MKSWERIAREYAIQDLRNMGYTYKQIADVFDVSYMTVWRACSPKNGDARNPTNSIEYGRVNGDTVI